MCIRDRRYTLRPGDLYILKPFELHYPESRESDSYERYIINLPVPVLHSLLTEGETRLLLHKLDSCVLHLSDEQAAEVLEHFKKADACHNRSGFLAEKLICSVILQLLEMCIRDRSEWHRRSGPSVFQDNSQGASPPPLP